MEIDAEFRRQIITALVAAIAFVIAVVIIGISFDGELTTSSLPPAGGLALIGLLIGFILTMAGIGFYLNQATTAN